VSLGESVRDLRTSTRTWGTEVSVGASATPTSTVTANETKNAIRAAESAMMPSVRWDGRASRERSEPLHEGKEKHAPANGRATTERRAPLSHRQRFSYRSPASRETPTARKRFPHPVGAVSDRPHALTLDEKTSAPSTLPALLEGLRARPPRKQRGRHEPWSSHPREVSRPVPRRGRSGPRGAFKPSAGYFLPDRGLAGLPYAGRPGRRRDWPCIGFSETMLSCVRVPAETVPGT
jgi:hypothetical protein